MNCEIITIGDEYLFGKADNSSALRISEYISGMGFDIKTQTVVSSGMNQLTSIFNAALRRSQLLIVIGGISGMHTVSSRETIARALNIKMVNNIKVEQKIKEHYEAKGINY